MSPTDKPTSASPSSHTDPAFVVPPERVDRALDVRGLNCPLPVLKARKALADMAPGARLLVLATDPRAPQDLEELCALVGHRLVEKKDHAGVHRLLIERSGAMD